MTVPWYVPLIGLVVGLLLGLTSLGGGSLLTPVLVLALRVSPATAVGTDLVCQAATRLAGVPVHLRQRSIDGRLVALIASGSIPAALLTQLIVASMHVHKLADNVVLAALGVALILTALTIAADPLLWRGRRPGADSDSAAPRSTRRTLITVLAGALVGVSVALTSVGAGSLVMALLVLAHPGLTSRRLVGTDLAHGLLLLPTTAVVALASGHVDLRLAGGILLGSVPGGVLGSRLAAVLPERPLRLTVAGVVLATGLRLLPL